MPKTLKDKKWFEVYTKLAIELSKAFKKNKIEFPELYYEKVFDLSKNIEERNWLFKNYIDIEDGEKKMIDPIQLYSWFNDSRLNENKAVKVKIINCLFKAIDEKKYTPYRDIDFDGCPAPITFRQINVRPNTVQFLIWEILVSVCSAKKESIYENLTTAFAEFSNWFGIDVPSFTIFLFWIDSSNFIAIDGKTENLLNKYGYLDDRPRTYYDYEKLVPIKNTNLYRTIVSIAGAEDSKIKFVNTKKILIKLLGKSIQDPSLDFGFGIVALELKNQNDFSKVLKINHLYQFYQCFKFDTHKENVAYIKEKDIKLYSSNDININISAIVGKNGTGKSTITDIIIIILNNLTIELHKENELISVSDIEADLYIHIDTLYKIELRETITIYKYEFQNSKYLNKYNYKINLNELFYSIVLNYSHYALNSLNYGNWIKQIFHKNDAYQVPIVLNPMRNEGNFDINRENDLVYNRMLSLILEPSRNDINSIRFINSKNKYIEKISIKLNTNKFEYLYKEYDSIKKQDTPIPFPYIYDVYSVIEAVIEEFEITSIKNIYKKIEATSNEELLLNYTFKYIYKKLINIARIYPIYNKYFDRKSVSIINLHEYLVELSNDNSHITNKLFQAINFLKYSLIEDFRNKISYETNGIQFRKTIKVDDYSDKIQNIIRNNQNIYFRGNSLKEFKVEEIIQFIPPSFFEIKLILNDESSFEDLSSGEKQKIFSMSTFQYHLSNINSVNISTNYIKYDTVNVIIDEIEMYFHPEMQRSYINNVISSFDKLHINDIRHVNIIFITHSPFILSDIPSNNVIFLDLDNENKAIQRDSNLIENNTFGGNITDILRNPFFLEKEGIIGDYAKKVINEMINWIKEEEKSNNFVNTQNEKHKTDFNDKFEYYFSVANIIGERVIKNKLIEMLEDLRIYKLGGQKSKQLQIEAFEREKRIIEQRINSLKDSL